LNYEVATIGEKAWAAKRLGWSHVPADCKGIAAVEDNAIHAVSLYEQFLGKSCVMHCVVENPRVLWTAKRVIFEYPFRQLGLNLILTFTPMMNVRSRDIQKALGFKEVAIIDDAYDDGKSIVINKMTRSECRWIRKAN
jgi:hypothetical protein